MVFKNSGMKIAPEGRARREAPRRRGEAPQTPIPEDEGKTIALIIKQPFFKNLKPPYACARGACGARSPSLSADAVLSG